MCAIGIHFPTSDMGIPALVRIQDIDMIARNHSTDMSERGYFEHDTPEGLDPTDRENCAGYSCLKDYGSYYTEGVAENISQSYTYSSYVTAGVTSSYAWYDDEETVAKNIVAGWMNSPGVTGKIFLRERTTGLASVWQ